MTATTTREQREAAQAELRALQARWSGTGMEEGWFASLELESAAAEDDRFVFVFHDHFGQRFGWRWRYAAGSMRDPDWRVLLSAHLMEDLAGGGWSLPDVDGVRWLLTETDVPQEAA